MCCSGKASRACSTGHGLRGRGQADDGDTCCALVEESRPDLAVVDIRMPPTHTTEGLAAAREIRARVPDDGDPRPVGVRRGGARDRAAGQRRAHRLPAQDPDHRRRRVPGDAAPGRRTAAPSSTRRSCRSSSPRAGGDDPLDVLSPAGARGARADGGGPLQRGHRQAALGHRGHGREARAEHPDEARPARDRRRRTAGSWPCSRSSKPRQQAPDRGGGQVLLRQEADRLAVREQVRDLLGGERRHHDHRAWCRCGRPGRSRSPRRGRRPPAPRPATCSRTARSACWLFAASATTEMPWAVSRRLAPARKRSESSTMTQRIVIP